MIRLRPVQAVAFAGAVVASALAIGSAAGSQAVPPTAGLASDGTYTAYTDCDGQVQVPPTGGVDLTVTLDAPAIVDTEVNLGYAGDLAVPELPTPVVVPAGAQDSSVVLGLTTPGTLAVTVLPGTGYVDGASTTLDVGPDPDGPACELDEVTVQGVVGGPLPDPYQPIGVELADSVPALEGELPPGISGDPFGPLSGTLTEPGTFRFSMRYDGPGSLVVYELRVTAVVGEVGAPEQPVPGPPPAVPLPGAAGYTG